MPTRELPPHPTLAQLELQAEQLQRDHREGRRPAAARIAAHHPRLKDVAAGTVLDSPLTLDDARLVLAREYGFPGWVHLERHVEMARHLAGLTPHPRFSDALAALDAGDVPRLRDLLGSDPRLIGARTNLDARHGYFAGATLLHHVAGNPSREAPLPDNVLEVAEVLLEAGAEVDARTLGTNGGTTMGLLVTSKQASDRGVSGPLMDLLLRSGATLDLESSGVLDPPLANHAPRAAERMIELGAQVDVLAAAALGRMDLLRGFFDDDGRLGQRPHRRGQPMDERDAIGLALLYAYVRRQTAAVDFVLEKDGNWDMTGVNNGTALHRAAWDGDLPMVQRLVALGADIENRDNPFVSTPLSWAQHNRQHAVMAWMREHCAIDLHDAVCLDLREHVEARLREDPASVHRRRDQWEIPRCTPLHWAAWPSVSDVHGTRAYDPASRGELVTRLLDAGADPDAIAGNGMTPLDIARAGGARGIAALLERHGGRPAEEL